MRWRASGFSLVEAMVSVAIISIGFAGLYATVSASMDALNKSTTRGQLDYLATRVLDDIETDIANISAYFNGAEGASAAPIDLFVNPATVVGRPVPTGAPAATNFVTNWSNWNTQALAVLGIALPGTALLSVTTVCSTAQAGACPSLTGLGGATTSRRSAILTLTIARGTGAFVARRMVDARFN